MHYQNLDDMIYSSWDVEQNVLECNVMGPENQNFEKMIKTLEDIILQMFTINDSHMIYGFSDMECKRQIFVILDRFLPFYLPTYLKKKKFWKNEKTPGMLYCSLDMPRNGFNCYFSFWAIFYPFTSLTAQKIKI